MAIFSVYILNRAGGLIYHYDHVTPKSEVEQAFSYPLDIVLREDDKIIVIFGERDNIKGKFKFNDHGHLVSAQFIKVVQCNYIKNNKFPLN